MNLSNRKSKFYLIGFILLTQRCKVCSTQVRWKTIIKKCSIVNNFHICFINHGIRVILKLWNNATYGRCKTTQ